MHRMSAPPSPEKAPIRRNACPMFVCCDASSRTQANSVVFDGGTEESVATLQPELVHPVSNRCPSENSGDIVAAEGAKVERVATPQPLPDDQLAPDQPQPPAAVEQPVSHLPVEPTETTAVLEDTPRIDTSPPDMGCSVSPVVEARETTQTAVVASTGSVRSEVCRPALVDSCLEVLFVRPGGGRPSRVLFRRRPLGLDFVPGVMPLEVVGASGAARALGVQQGWWVERFGGAELKSSFAEAEEAVRLLTQELPEREEATGGGCSMQ